MDEITLRHLRSFVINRVRVGEQELFTDDALTILSDAEELEYYGEYGWQKLYDRFYQEILA